MRGCASIPDELQSTTRPAYAQVYNVDPRKTSPGGNSIAKTLSATAKRGQLSRSRILATALELVDQDGLDALTMRRLADRLRVDPMSIYNHIDGKQVLLDGLAQTLWERVDIPPGPADWRKVLRSFATSLRGLALTRAHAYGLLCRARLSESALRTMDLSREAPWRAAL